MLSESDFLKFAFHRYDNPHLSSVEDFESDIRRFTYLNNLLNRYRLDPLDLKDRLVLNHIVILANCFTVSGCLTMLNYKILDDNKSTLETFLFFLGYIDKTNYKLDFKLLGILNEN